MSDDELIPYDLTAEPKVHVLLTPGWDERLKALTPQASSDDPDHREVRERWEQAAAKLGVENVIFQGDTGAAKRLRESLTRIYGPEVMREARSILQRLSRTLPRSRRCAPGRNGSRRRFPAGRRR